VQIVDLTSKGVDFLFSSTSRDSIFDFHDEAKNARKLFEGPAFDAIYAIRANSNDPTDRELETRTATVGRLGTILKKLEFHRTPDDASSHRK
jgi:hypothetical protein